MADVKVTVRLMTKEDVPQALDVWRETGMQEGTHSLYTWLKVDPEAFHVAVTDEGEVIGACSAVIHDEDIVHVGMYCVREKHRGLGVGIKVWNACMEHVGDRNVCLNGVPDKVKLYKERGGFPILETNWVCVMNETTSPVHPETLSDTSPASVDIVPFEDSHLPLICDYDSKLIGYDRKLALELNCKEPGSRSFVALKDGACVGFGTIKMSCQEAGQVGPLYADGKEIAEVILKRLILSLSQVKGFAMMTMSNNGPANELMERIGCPTTEKLPRLYRRTMKDVDASKVFAQFDLNFSPY